ncbi:RIK [Symbiodinium sp. CCMP2592]|nr:RIK [Symbiodinium sp. CCMP2592]
MAVLPKGPPSVDRAAKRSRSPSDRYIIPRLSLQNNDADGEASPRAPLSPRGNVPVAPYAALSSPQPSSDVTKKLPEKISPRFGVPRDENNPEGGRNSVPRLSGGKRGGSCLTARSSSTSKLNSALRESSCGSARSKIRERRPNPLLSNSPPARSAPAPQAGSPSRANQSSRLSCDSSSSSSLHSGPSLVGENVSSATRSTRSVAVTPCASTTSLIVPYAGHRPIPAGSNATAAHSAGTAVEDLSGRVGSYTADPSMASFRSVAEGQRSSGPLSTGSEDCHVARSQLLSGPNGTDADADAETMGDHVELLCLKAQSLVRQLGSGMMEPSQSVRSLQKKLVLLGQAAEVTPVAPPFTPRCIGGPLEAGTGDASSMDLKFSPAPDVADPIMPNIGEELAELRGRLGRVERALQGRQGHAAGGPGWSSSEVLNLRGRLQTVESELVDVRAELREACATISHMACMWEKMEKPEVERRTPPVPASTPPQDSRIAGPEKAKAADQDLRLANLGQPPVRGIIDVPPSSSPRKPAYPLMVPSARLGQVSQACGLPAPGVGQGLCGYIQRPVNPAVLRVSTPPQTLRAAVHQPLRAAHGQPMSPAWRWQAGPMGAPSA